MTLLTSDTAYTALELSERVYSRSTLTVGPDAFYVEALPHKGEVHAAIAGSNDRKDWRDNFWFARKRFGDVRAQKRWYQRAEDFMMPLHEELLAYPDLKWVIEGHSYGGAAASCFAEIIQRVDTVVTFNSPKAFQKFYSPEAEDTIKNKSHHFINTADVVWLAPPRNKCFGNEYKRYIRGFGPEHSDFEKLGQIIHHYLGDRPAA